jgi:hypothetical protein
VISSLCINSAFAIPKTITDNFTRLSDLQNSDIDLFINNQNINHDLTQGDFDLKIFFDGRALLRGTQYPQNIKVEVYTIVDGNKNFISIVNKTVKSNKAAQNILLLTRLPRLKESSELLIDLYDSNNVLTTTYAKDVTVTASETTDLSQIESISDYNCLDGDGECLIEYILRNLTFSASYDRNLKTEVIKNNKGRYTVSIPVKKGRTLKSKVKRIKAGNNGGKTSGKGFAKLADPYPYFENEIEVATTYWNEVRDAIEFGFVGSDNKFNFKKNGSLQLSTSTDNGYLNIAAGTLNKAPIIFNQGELLTNPIEGALEYDGENLYFTNGNSRTVLGLTGPAGPPGAPRTGGSGSGIDLSNGGYLNGTINFISGGLVQDAIFNGSLQYRNGANNGLVLTSDANGNATWQPVMILVNSTVLSTGPLGSIQFSGVSNGFDFDYNNFFWDNTNNRLGLGTNTPNSTLTVNGNFTLKNGSQANGYVLTSDINGNASWQDPSSC